MLPPEPFPKNPGQSPTGLPKISLCGYKQSYLANQELPSMDSPCDQIEQVLTCIEKT